MALSVGFRITVSLLILLPKLRGSDSYPGGTDSHRTRQPSLDAQWPLIGRHFSKLYCRFWADSGPLSPHVPDQLDLLFNEHVDFMKVVPPSDLY